jgi:hypothetical protein
MRLAAKVILPTLVMALFIGTGQIAAQSNDDGRLPSSNPNDARLVTSDITNFWRAYDQAGNKLAAFQAEYFDKGSYGLREFTRLRINSPRNLVGTMEASPRYYASIRESTLSVDSMKDGIMASFIKLKTLYPEAVFPDVYFLIGVMNSGGTTTDRGLLIGTEMYGLTNRTPNEELTDWHRAVLKSIDALPQIVTHELIHYEQKYPKGNRTLLGQAIDEGSADFIGELAAGGNINESLHTYGNPRERELWVEFQKDMNGRDTSKWLYQGGKAKDRPADLGYYVGYKICESYYAHAVDKKQAIKDILEIKDFNLFLAASRYGEKFAANQ